MEPATSKPARSQPGPVADPFNLAVVAHDKQKTAQALAYLTQVRRDHEKDDRCKEKIGRDKDQPQWSHVGSSLGHSHRNGGDTPRADAGQPGRARPPEKPLPSVFHRLAYQPRAPVHAHERRKTEGAKPDQSYSQNFGGYPRRRQAEIEDQRRGSVNTHLGKVGGRGREAVTQPIQGRLGYSAGAQTQSPRMDRAKMALMQEAIEKLQADQAQARTNSTAIVLPTTPLSSDIINAPIQKKIAQKPPPIPIFGGEVDPHVHLGKFTDYMVAMGASDATQCRAFPMSLGDWAHRWFSSLPAGSVRSFTQLGQNFLSYFSALASRPAPKQRVVNFSQLPDESDRTYVERFDKLLIEG